ncbi:MAG: SPOR domain-containing protein [Acidobacteria bacterium]|nr:SPOR domain-containing protein [Acidobacteriota bacterium]
MTTQEETYAPAAVAETATFEVAPAPSLEDAPPLLLECEPTPFFEEVPPTPTLEVAPPPAPARPARKTAAPNVNAPDPFAVGVRLLRMAPAWLLLVTVLCGALVLLLGWVRGDGDASALGLSAKQNDARAAQTSPKPEAPAPKPAAADSPEVATPAAAAPAPNDVPDAPPAQAAAPAPAPAEQPAPPAPKAVETAQPAQPDDAGAKFTVQVGSYNNQSEANEHVSRLRAAGFDSRSAAVELPGRGTWHRVQVGRFAERAEASKTVAQLRAKGAAAGALVAPLQ